MSWHAKPSGGYVINSDPWKENLVEIYNQLGSTWNINAICGMIGNMQSESGINPWRWQSDSVSLTDSKKGYGLPQFTPAYGYINDYGKGVSGYAPNLSASSTTSGASPSDGHAQLIVIDTDRAGKYINRASYCKFADISPYPNMTAFKQCGDLWLATVAWLYNYEFPAAAYRDYASARGRYQNSVAAYEFLWGKQPDPDPPDPPDPPVPPDPPKPGKHRGMPIYIYYERRKKWF